MSEPARGSAVEVLLSFLRLGLTSFGGPIAHLGFFHAEFVTRRRWLEERRYADLVALCQFLPGPASSQVGMGIGLQRAGLPGLLAAWLGFTLPSAALMSAFALGLASFGNAADGPIAGLKAAAVAVVAQAVIAMARSAFVRSLHVVIAVFASVAALGLPGLPGQMLGLAIGAAAGAVFLRGDAAGRDEGRARPAGIRPAIAALTTFAVLLLVLPLLAQVNETIALLDRFYRAGALVFGGGHVVLPLLEAEMVQTGLVSESTFLAGYGAAQAMPGPLFSFAAFLGAAAATGPNGIGGAVLATLAIFLPSALLIMGALPLWEWLRGIPAAQAGILGLNAAVVGLLAAAFADPVLATGVTSPATAAIVLVAFVALVVLRLPAWAIVIGAAAVGLAL